MNKQKKILTLPIRLAIVVLIIGAFFKIMHWSYSQELMLYGSISIAVLYSIRFFYKSNKDTFDYVKLAIVLLWTLRYFVQVFHLFNFPYILEIALLLLFLWWFISDGVNYFSNRKYKIKGAFKLLYFTLIALCLVALFCGVLLKIQHWPYGELLFTIGILLLIILIIADYFVVERPHKN